jgi:aspartate carbamoyltransferase catalytic subunit
LSRLMSGSLSAPPQVPPPGKDLLSIDNLSNGDIALILKLAARFRDGKSVPRAKKARTVALFFDQGSTRSRLGYQAAAQRLGHNVIDGQDGAKSRYASGHENFDDHIRVLAAYGDLIITRTPQAETVHRIAAVAAVPVLNCGNGPDEHPTQALIDLFTILSLYPRKKIGDITITISGDPNSRHFKPFMKLMARTPAKAILFCHGRDARNKRIGRELSAIAPQVPFREIDRVEDGLSADILSICASNITKKVSAAMAAGKTKNTLSREAPAFTINRAKLEKARSKIKIMHPMPREGELDTSCDDLPNNAYFKQLELSLYLRMAVLHLVLGGHRWSGRKEPA